MLYISVDTVEKTLDSGKSVTYSKFSPNANSKQIQCFQQKNCAMQAARVPSFQFIINRQDNVHPLHKQKHSRKEKGGWCLSNIQMNIQAYGVEKKTD